MGVNRANQNVADTYEHVLQRNADGSISTLDGTDRILPAGSVDITAPATWAEAGNAALIPDSKLNTDIARTGNAETISAAWTFSQAISVLGNNIDADFWTKFNNIEDNASKGFRWIGGGINAHDIERLEFSNGVSAVLTTLSDGTRQATVTIGNVTSSTPGFMLAADKNKLDLISLTSARDLDAMQAEIDANSDKTHANNGRLTISTETGLTGSGVFDANQSANTTITIGLDSDVALIDSPNTFSANQTFTNMNVTGSFTLESGATLSGVRFSDLSGAVSSTQLPSTLIYRDGTGILGTEGEGKFPASNSDGDLEWSDLNEDNFSSGSASSGQFFTADGSGGASWTTYAIPFGNSIGQVATWAEGHEDERIPIAKLPEDIREITIVDNGGTDIGGATTLRMGAGMEATISGETATLTSSGGGGGGANVEFRGFLDNGTAQSNSTYNDIEFATGLIWTDDTENEKIIISIDGASPNEVMGGVTNNTQSFGGLKRFLPDGSNQAVEIGTNLTTFDHQLRFHRRRTSELSGLLGVLAGNSVYDTDKNRLTINDGSNWKDVAYTDDEANFDPLYVPTLASTKADDTASKFSVETTLSDLGNGEIHISDDNDTITIGYTDGGDWNFNEDLLDNVTSGSLLAIWRLERDNAADVDNRTSYFRINSVNNNTTDNTITFTVEPQLVEPNHEVEFTGTDTGDRGDIIDNLKVEGLDRYVLYLTRMPETQGYATEDFVNSGFIVHEDYSSIRSGQDNATFTYDYDSTGDILAANLSTNEFWFRNTTYQGHEVTELVFAGGNKLAANAAHYFQLQYVVGGVVQSTGYYKPISIFLDDNDNTNTAIVLHRTPVTGDDVMNRTWATGDDLRVNYAIGDAVNSYTIFDSNFSGLVPRSGTSNTNDFYVGGDADWHRKLHIDGGEDDDDIRVIHQFELTADSSLRAPLGVGARQEEVDEFTHLASIAPRSNDGVVITFESNDLIGDETVFELMGHGLLRVEFSGNLTNVPSLGPWTITVDLDSTDVTSEFTEGDGGETTDTLAFTFSPDDVTIISGDFRVLDVAVAGENRLTLERDIQNIDIVTDLSLASKIGEITGEERTEGLAWPYAEVVAHGSINTDRTGTTGGSDDTTARSVIAYVLQGETIYRVFKSSDEPADSTFTDDEQLWTYDGTETTDAGILSDINDNHTVQNTKNYTT